MLESREETTEVQPSVSAETEASIGRFDSPEALYNSYVNLQRDYTKKCQLLKNAENERTTVHAPADYGDEMNALKEKLPEIGKIADELESYEGSAAERLARYILNASGESNQYNADEIKSKLCADSELRAQIFREMLDDFVNALPPEPAKNRGKTVITAAARPKSLSEASSLAQKIIKNRRI